MSLITRAATQGERFARARKFRGFNQTEMARTLGVATSTISNWENDHVDPPLSAAAKWATLTGQTIDWLVWGDRGDEEAPSGEGASALSQHSVRLEGLEPPTF
ncbi:helix-turn-helix transcriptional regulator [Microbacterium panaciterrae]|uniref:helix-turn-helix transcriptional regulator n=1 Tax=Microbacterium panaciterrae TaxID=985759 RepID=UPI0031E4F7A2